MVWQPAVRPPPRLAELLVVVALIVGGAWLRWYHLGTPSLWWDEIVHIRIAEQPTLAGVWRTARDGGAPGSGNAGAVPLDYLVLHAWLRATPTPAPESMERHNRVPAFVFAVAALPLAWVLGRGLGGPASGTLALGLLAASMPHVLYAAEARFYSLYVLTTLVNLLAFAALVRGPSAGRLVVFGIACVAFVLSGLYAVFPVAAEYLVLAVLVWRSRAVPRVRGLLAMAASGLAVAGVLALWVAPTSVGWSYGRGAPKIDVPMALDITLRFFAGYELPLAVAFGAAFLLAPLVARRDRVASAVTAVFVLSACSVAIMVAIAHAKQYYFHPRHALFLLPMVHLATALVVGRAIARVVHAPTAAAVAGGLLALVVTAPTVRAYVADPFAYFHATKTFRDYRGLTRLIAERIASGPANAGYLLLLEKRRPGHLANPTLRFYLERYGIADRVVLAGIDDPAHTLTKLPKLCPARCRGRVTDKLREALRGRDPYDQNMIMRRLMQLPESPWRNDLLGIGVVAWAPTNPRKPAGVRDIRLNGLTLFESAAMARAGHDTKERHPFQTGALGRVAYDVPPCIQSGPFPQ